MAEIPEVREDALLGLTALCGDLPTKLLTLLPGSTEWTRKTVSVRRADKLLRRHHKNGVPSLRLTQKGRALLNRACPERFQPLFTECYLARCRKSDLVSVERIHRTAAAYLLMFRASVRLYPDEKPPFYQLGNTLDFSVPVFYSSLEIKPQGLESTRIKATRAVGLLMGMGYAALVYHTGAAPLKWSSKAEQKLMGAVKGILMRQRIPVSEVEGLMIGANMETALSLLQSDGGNRRQYFRLDGTFPVMRYLPWMETLCYLPVISTWRGSSGSKLDWSFSGSRAMPSALISRRTVWNAIWERPHGFICWTRPRYGSEEKNHVDRKGKQRAYPPDARRYVRGRLHHAH